MDLSGRVGPEAHPTNEVTLSTCPFCSSGCGLLLHTRGSELVGVSPSKNHPISRGRLCARGWGAHEGPLWGERLLFPSIKGDAGRRRVSWEEGLAHAAEQLRTLLESGRKVGVLGSGRVTNEEAFLGARLARDALGTPHVDSSLRSSFQAMLASFRPDEDNLDLRGILEFVEGSDLILLLEDDLTRSHPNIAFLLMKALARGSRLVTMGPSRTQMSTLARPPLFLDPTGYPEGPPELEDVLGAASDVGEVALLLAPFTSDATRLSSTVREVLRRVKAWGGDWGPEIRCLPLPLFANTRGAFEMGLAPGFLPGVRSLSDQVARDRLQSVWGVQVRMDVGVSAERMLGEVEGLIVLRENPPETQPSPAESLKALSSMQCLIALGAYRSPSTELATVTLPLGAFSETHGSLVSLDGLVQRWRPVCSPPGEAREGWRVLVDLLTELGVDAPYRSLTDVEEEIGRVVPEFGQGMLEEGAKPWMRRVPDLRIPKEEPLFPSEKEEPPGEEGDLALPGPGVSFRIALVGTHEWGDDLIVGFSPTLRREGVSLRKLFPAGRVSISRSDADRLGVRDGWKVRIRSQSGEMEVPVSLGTDVEPGNLLAPFGFRDQLSGILDGAVQGQVMLERP